MKRTHIFILCAALLAFATACQSDVLNPYVAAEEEGIVLTISCGDLLTKATAPAAAGDAEYNNYHENYIKTIDYFFYPEGAADTDISVKHGRFDVNAAVDIGEERNLSVTVNDHDINDLLFPRPSTTCTVYLIANYDGATDIQADANTSRATLKALVLNRANFISIDPGQSVYHNFVMDGEKTVTLTSRTQKVAATAKVPLKRIASKITLKVAFSASTTIDRSNYSYTDDETGVAYIGTLTETWKPMNTTEAGMRIWMVSAVNYATMAGALYDPETVNPPVSPTPYFDYDKEKFKYTGQEEGTFTYSSTTEFDPESGEPVQKTMDVTYFVFPPFYSYPQKWAYGAAAEPYLKLQVPWARTGSARFKSDDGTIDKVIQIPTTQKMFYYKVICRGGQLERNTWYDNRLYVSILGSELDDALLLVDCQYYIVDWNTVPEVDASVRDARYLSVPQTKYELYNVNDLKFLFDSSHPCSYKVESVTRKKYSSSGTTDEDLTQNANFSYTVGINNDESSLSFAHVLRNGFSYGANMDYSPITYVVTVYHSDKLASDPNYAKTVTIVQYPAIYVQKRKGGNAFVDGYYTLVTGGRPETGDQGGTRSSGDVTYYYHGGSFNPFNDGTRITPYGNLNGNSASDATIPSSELENTVIHVTAFSKTSNTYTFNGSTKPYIIGDPRVPFMESTSVTNKTITDYLTSGGNNNGTTAWTNAQRNALMVGTDDDNIIAPAFMFASEWGRQGTGASRFETVAHRCATYQEAGFPAGRWRLPTEAEVAFVANLQAQQFIGRLFDQGQYWISNGTALTVSAAGAINSVASGNSTRCVYDIWYWGEEPITSPNNKDYNASYKDYYYYVMP